MKRYAYLLDGLGWSRVLWTAAISCVAAAAVVWIFKNTYLDLLVSALCVGYTIMLFITVAGNLRQHAVPREAAQMVAVVLGSVTGTLLSGVVKGRPFAQMFTERIWGVSITMSLGIGIGVVVTVMYIMREQKARALADLHKAESERHQLEKQMLATRLQVMQAQVEPHFLFNTLANVQHLVEADAKAASRMLDNLIRYLRIALPQMRDSSSTLGREIDMAAAYLEIFKIRMGNRMTYEVRLPQALREQPFPPMMIITLVENAIKHGIDPCCECSGVVLSADVADGRLTVAVADTGQGLQPTAGGGVGLANIRERLATLFGKSARLQLAENQPRGVVATIDLPLQTALSGMLAA